MRNKKSTITCPIVCRIAKGGETFTDNVDNMETAYDSLDEAIGYLQEILDR